MFFERDDKSAIKSVDFLEEIGALFYLLDNSMRILTSTQTQINFFEAITVLRIIISNMKTNITDQREEEKKENFCKTRKCFE